jgi:UDP-N-acetylbacillosamine N-acetyltransferase
VHRLAIWGASGHAAVVADIVRLERRYELVCFIVDTVAPVRHRLPAPVFSGLEQLDFLRSRGVSHLIVAVGDCAARARLAETAVSRGLELATAVHPQATIASCVDVGAGTVIVAGAVVNPGTSIGRNVIVNTAATIDHDCVIGDAVHIGPGCHLGGSVTVGRETWLGIGAIVRDRIMIGNRVVVGAGAVVVADLAGGVLTYGVPARVIKHMVRA